MAASRRCPCGSGDTYAACCGPLHAGRGSGRVTAQTPEQLMRSRYSAFAVGHDVYLLATWHPSTRPATLTLDDRFAWRRLEVLEAHQDGDRGVVAFVAHYWDTEHRQRGEQAERSTFVREDGQWFYVAAAG